MRRAVNRMRIGDDEGGGKGASMSIKFTPAVILYIVAVVLFLLAAVGAGVGAIGIEALGLASLVGGMIIERWEK
jgi:hypothetical protein